MIGIPLLRETYAPVIRLRKAKRSNDPERLADILAMNNASEDKLRYLWVNLSRPITMLVRSFICFILSLYMALYVFYLSFNKYAHTELYCIAYMVRISSCLFLFTSIQLYAGVYYLMFTTFPGMLRVATLSQFLPLFRVFQHNIWLVFRYRWTGLLRSRIRFPFSNIGWCEVLGPNLQICKLSLIPCRNEW